MPPFYRIFALYVLEALYMLMLQHMLCYNHLLSCLFYLICIKYKFVLRSAALSYSFYILSSVKIHKAKLPTGGLSSPKADSEEATQLQRPAPAWELRSTREPCLAAGVQSAAAGSQCVLSTFWTSAALLCREQDTFSPSWIVGRTPSASRKASEFFSVGSCFKCVLPNAFK